MELTEKVLSSEELYHGKIINLRRDQVELPDGRVSTREVVEHPGGVGVLPIDEEGNTYLVRQYRKGARNVLLEIPAGKIDPNEDALTCGKRELLEEIGAEAEEYVSLGILHPTPAYCEEIIPIYLATGLTFSVQDLDEGEFLQVVKIPFEIAYQMVLSGEITDAKTQIAILKVKTDPGIDYPGKIN